MSASNLPMVITSKRAWNHGRIIGQKRPLPALSSHSEQALFTRFQRFLDAVAPPFGHLFAFIPVLRAMISISDLIGTNIGEFGFNCIR